MQGNGLSVHNQCQENINAFMYVKCYFYDEVFASNLTSVICEFCRQNSTFMKFKIKI